MVCAECSYGNKKELECVSCRSDNPSGFAHQTVSNGYCEQLDKIVETAASASYRKQVEELFNESPGAYAEATVQRSQLMTPFSLPLRTDVKHKKKKKKKGNHGCCYFTCFCCLIEPIYEFFKPLLKGIVITVIILWFIWAINYYTTGNNNLRNLPIFSSIPHAEASAQSPAPVWNDYRPPPTNHDFRHSYKRRNDL